jgi:hypothetical protein
MKALYLFPLLFLSACSTAPRLALTPQSPSPTTDDAAVRYPEVIRAYHVGRYADPSDDLVMHEQHVVYRVEENTRWDLHPATIGSNGFLPAVPVSHDAAFSQAPVNEAILAEVNSQRLATGQIMLEARTLSSAWRNFKPPCSRPGPICRRRQRCASRWTTSSGGSTSSPPLRCNRQHPPFPRPTNRLVR